MPGDGRPRAAARSTPGGLFALLLLVGLLLGPAARAAQVELVPPLTDPPRRAVWLAHDGGGPNLLVPWFELVGLNFAVWGVDKALGKSYANISLDTMWTHVWSEDWEWDDDPYVSNFIAHPYQGAMPFSAARASGLNFWASAPFALVSSLMWELLLEKLPPSPNDVIVTTLAGIVVGETLHRLSLLVLDGGGPGVARWLVASLLDPVGNFDFLLFGRKSSDFSPHAPLFARLFAGGAFNLGYDRSVAGVPTELSYGPQLLLGFDLTSGLPGLGTWKLRDPFDHFDVSVRLGLVRDAYVAFFLRGLVAGTSFELGPARGLWGLFAGYDFANPDTLRASTVSVGPGASAQFQVTRTLSILPTVVVSGVPFGGGGSLPAFIGDRNYHYGFGAQSLVSVQAAFAGLGRVGVDWRFYFLSGAFRNEGWEAISYVSPFVELAVTAHGSLGLSAFFGDRQSHFPGVPPDTTEHARELNVYWSVMTGDRFAQFQRSDP